MAWMGRQVSNMAETIAFKLNGMDRQVDVEPNEILLDVLRNKLGIKSPKIGCNRGDCGTCTVLLNEHSVRSCLVFAVEVNGQEITTVEGLSQDGLSPLQQSFLRNNSFQCGFCASGILITATELLSRTKHPSKEEVKEALSGNLCRCTGYEPIIDAICDCHSDKGKRNG